MKIEALKAVSYQECTRLHSVMDHPATCTMEALCQSYRRLFALFDLLSLLTSEERAEALLVFTYHDTFAEPQQGRAHDE